MDSFRILVLNFQADVKNTQFGVLFGKKKRYSPKSRLPKRELFRIIIHV